MDTEQTDQKPIVRTMPSRAEHEASKSPFMRGWNDHLKANPDAADHQDEE